MSQRAPLYGRVAGKMEKQILAGTFKPGERIPSVRKMMAKLKVSLSTILQAYESLENKGLIEARPQSGYYVRLIPRDLPQEPKMSAPASTAKTVDIGALALQVYESTIDPRIVPLGANAPAKELLPTQKLNRILRSVTRRSETQTNRYETTAGNLELRRQIAKRSVDLGCSFSPDQIVITAGCTEALNLCLRCVASPGDTVAVESPTYFGVLQILQAMKLKALEIPTDPRHGISIDALESVIKKRRVAAICVQPNFQNPLGCSMPEENQRGLIELATRKKIPIIEDDIYGDLFFEGRSRPRVLKALDRENVVMLCSSFSKTLCPGFRIGWMNPGEFLLQAQHLKMTGSICNPAILQMALAEMLRSGGYDRFLRNVRRRYASQIQMMIQAVRKYFPEGTKVTRPGGGMLLWVEFPQSVDTVALYQQAIARNISIVPGPLFSAGKQFRNCIRLNCGHPWSERIEDAMISLGRLAMQMM